MARSKKAYVCTQCDARAVKWQGYCPSCGEPGTLEEAAGATAGGYPGEAAVAELAALAAAPQKGSARLPTGFAEFDRVLGGGLVPGSVVLLGGDPGVGKSTLMLQVAAALGERLETLYATGEESLAQVAGRARRLGLAERSVALVAETRIDAVLETAARRAASLVVVDSMQTMSDPAVGSAPGSVTQLRECVGRLVRHAKQAGVAVFVVGHVTKEGVIAGPRVVEHMVDTVLYFESDPASRFSIVRAVKNRFGASNELGMFAMTDAGFREVKNPSAMFLSQRAEPVPGSVVTVAWEGSRPLLVEVQALVAGSAGNHPRRLAQGLDQNRLSLLLAVLQRHGGLSLAGEDVFLNVVGGLRIAEPAADLPAVLAAVSSFRDASPAARLVSFGELGLAGEIRPVRYGVERLAEAAKQGLRRAIVPRANLPKKRIEGIEVTGAERLADALEAAF